jgi:hypothetical protein
VTPDSAAGLLAVLSTLKDVGAFGVLGMGCWLLLTSRIVTRGHLDDVVAGKNAEIAKAEAREAEWRRLAVRGADEILPPLVTVARTRVREQLRELHEAQEP